jgi:ribosomal protein L34E
MFEQDLEDLTEETREEISRQRTPRGKKAEQKPVGDVMCAECRAINGHLPSCSYRKTKETQTKEPEPEKKPELLKWLVQVEAVDIRKKTVKDKTGKETERPYRMLTCINAANENITLYAWDTKHYERIDAIKPKTRCIFMVKSTESAGKIYYSVDSIVEITGEQIAQEDMVPEEEKF